MVRLSLSPAVLLSFLLSWDLLQTSASAQNGGQDQATLRQRLQHASELTALDLPGTRPWHTRSNITTTTGDGIPISQDMVEEWWAEPNLWRATYTTASGAVTTEIRNHDGLFRTRGAPHISGTDRRLEREVVHPIPRLSDLDKLLLQSRTESVGGHPYDCIAVSRPLVTPPKQPAAVMEERYCFTSGSDQLRIVYPSLYRVVGRVTLGKFQDRDVPMEVQDRGATDGMSTLKLIELKTETPDPSMFVISDNALERVPERPLFLGGVQAGRKLSGSNPVYPQAARAAHLTGTVTFSAVIGKDGHLVELEPVSSPSGILTRAAFEAVRDWTYQPYLLGGDPVEVETTIAIHFDMHP